MKQLTLDYLLTEGNILYVIHKAGFNTINVDKFTITHISKTVKQDEFSIKLTPVYRNSFSFPIFVYFTKYDIESKLKNNVMTNIIGNIFAITNDPHKLKRIYEKIMINYYHLNPLENAIHENYEISMKKQELQYWYTQNIYKNIKRNIFKIKEYIKNEQPSKTR